MAEPLSYKDLKAQGGETPGERLKRLEIEHEKWLMRRVGSFRINEIPDVGVSAEYNMNCCGKEITMPVMDIECDAQGDLINADYLEKLQMTPAERRARVHMELHGKVGTKKDPEIKMRGLRSKLALDKNFGEDTTATFEEALKKRTRHEILAKL